MSDMILVTMIHDKYHGLNAEFGEFEAITVSGEGSVLSSGSSATVTASVNRITETKITYTFNAVFQSESCFQIITSRLENAIQITLFTWWSSYLFHT